MQRASQIKLPRGPRHLPMVTELVGAEQLQSPLHLASGFHWLHFCCLHGFFPAGHLAREEPCMQSALLTSDPSFVHEK